VTTVLRYTGNEEGVPFVMGVPARNLSDDDLAALVGGRLGNDRGAVKRTLLKTGVYSEVSHSKEAAPAADHKADKEAS
jgi:hypothetical protein